MEAPHVINTDSQVCRRFFDFFECFLGLLVLSGYSFQLWAAVVSSGVGNVQLNASYKSADSYAFQVCCQFEISSRFSCVGIHQLY